MCSNAQISVNSQRECNPKALFYGHTIYMHRALTIGTDCSGIEAPIEALKQMKVPFVHKWSCDNDKFVRMSIEANYKPEIMYEDVTKRNNGLLPDVDIYVCGFPCQPFSLLGNQLGTKDERGGIMKYCIDVIRTKQPKLYILENVKNFKSIHGGKPFRFLKKELESIGNYNLYIEMYNTKDYGIPQNRERVYFIGIRDDIKKAQYTTPKPIHMKPLDDFLLDNQVHNISLQKSKLAQLQTKYSKILTKKSSLNYVASLGINVHVMEDVSPTLVRSPHYLLKYRRYMLPRECLLLQGFTNRFNQVVSNSQLMKQAGNAMSVNVLKAIFRSVFKSTDLCQHHTNPGCGK